MMEVRFTVDTNHSPKSVPPPAGPGWPPYRRNVLRGIWDQFVGFGEALFGIAAVLFLIGLGFSISHYDFLAVLADQDRPQPATEVVEADPRSERELTAKEPVHDIDELFGESTSN